MCIYNIDICFFNDIIYIYKVFTYTFISNIQIYTVDIFRERYTHIYIYLNLVYMFSFTDFRMGMFSRNKIMFDTGVIIPLEKHQFV